MPADPLDRLRDAVAREEPMPLADHDADPVAGRRRDGVASLADGGDPTPVVSVSDVHGYREAARSALLTLADHPDYDPIVRADDAGRLHWAGNDYVLVINGDMVDRGPENAQTLAAVARLIDEAPPGRVRVTLGNHEMGILTPALFRWGDWFSVRVGDDGRRAFCEQIRDGHVVAAYDGYEYTYAHAGQPTPYEVASVNDALVAAAERLHAAVGTSDDAATQQAVVDDCPLVLGMAPGYPKDAGAGLVWLDFRHLPRDAPPQVVGHTRHDAVTREGRVVCQNVIRNTRDRAGGEAVCVETPASLVALTRTADGGVRERSLDE